MRHPIPEQLRNPDFRFFLIGRGSKFPIEKRWNNDNNYMFFETKVANHIRGGGNVGVCTGFGRLVVIDFDDADFQKEKESLMPDTFTTKSAGKGLKHYYYLLKGEMFAKMGIDRGDVRVADIQAGRCGLTIPPSKIGGRFYSVVRDEEIAEITVPELSKIFGLKSFRKARQRRTDFSDEVMPLKIQATIDLFKKVGIPRTDNRHFRCPLHPMKGKGNLWVGDQGEIHCFHCGFHKESAEKFLEWWEERDGVKIQI